MELRAVMNGFALLWPTDFEERFRGRGYQTSMAEGRRLVKPPYVVDLTATLERDYFLAGQEHKLRELTEDERESIKGPTEIEDFYALSVIRRASDGELPPSMRVEELVRAHGAQAAEWIESEDAPGIPVPDPTARPRDAQRGRR